jgi:CBS domain containing-hemolysin-like protein
MILSGLRVGIRNPRSFGSSTHLVVLMEEDGQTVLGVVTLHDLLRAEVEKAKDSEE